METKQLRFKSRLNYFDETMQLSLRSVPQKSQFHAQYSSCSCAAGFRSSHLEELQKVHEKNVEKFQERSSCFSYDAVYKPAMLIKNELVHWYFSIILIGNLSQLLSDFQNNYLQNIGWLLPCAVSNLTIENFVTLQRSSTWFLFM